MLEWCRVWIIIIIIIIIVMLLLYWSVKFMVLYWYSGLVIAGSEPNAEELETEHDRRRFQVHKISDTYCVV